MIPEPKGSEEKTSFNPPLLNQADMPAYPVDSLVYKY
jgi:hypothetical protein